MSNDTPSRNKQNHGQGQRLDFPRLLSGNLCLDFVNSIDERSGPHPAEYLHSYADLAAWGEHVWQLTTAQVAGLLEQAEQAPQAAAACFDSAIELREALHRIFLAVAHGQHWAQEDEQRLRSIYLDAIGHARLHPDSAAYHWWWPDDDRSLSRVLWPVAQAAVELLCSDMLSRVKECPGANDCGWLFLDTSKNGTRRWCSMESCGSRVKMRRQYARKKADAG